MRNQLVLLAALAVAALPATAASPRHHRHHRHAPRAVPVDYAPAPVAPGGLGAPLGSLPLVGPLVGPLAGSLSSGLAPTSFAPGPGRPIPPEAARFMGYPYDVPGYRYAGYDGCLLRVGGVFGPGPSAGPCPFGLDRAF